jgi:hypothetical protein
MPHRYVMLFTLVVCICIESAGQVNQQGMDEKHTPIPDERILLLTAAQPLAPVRFEQARLSTASDRHTFEISFDVHNIGTKPIRHMTSVIWTSFGTGGTLRSQQIKGILRPGEVLKNNSSRQTADLSGELSDNLKGPVKVLVVLLVEEVTFLDGSTYSDRGTSKALLSYFEDLADKIERLHDIDRAATKRIRK